MTAGRRGTLAVLAAAGLFATSGTTRQVLAPDSWPPAVAAVRLLFGAAGLIAYVAVVGHGVPALRFARRPEAVAMGLGVAGYQGFFFLGIGELGVAVGTLIALGCAPLLAGLLAWLVGDGGPGWAWLGGTVVAVTGLAILVGSGGPGQEPTPAGVAFAVLAGACYATYTVLGARAAARGVPPAVVMAAPFTWGALLLLPLLPSALPWLGTARGAALAIWLGLVATTVAYLLFAQGLAVLRPGVVASLTLAEPVGATLLGVLLLGEQLSPAAWSGCVLILLGLLFVGAARPPASENQTAAARECADQAARS